MAEITATHLVVGMEVHVELATQTKMFSRSRNVAHPDHFNAEPNTLVDPVVAGLPGALPVMNKRAVELAMRVGLALNCDIAPVSVWDRKNYFYPDLPKGYQISQYDLPICFDGELTLTRPDGSTTTVGITRAHLEEDSGKLSHELPGGAPCEGSLLDLNRAGTPLLEIVSRPEVTSADDAELYCRELRTLCRFLGVSEADMQRGHMRFEPNINVVIETSDGHRHATPIVEIKNLNSFRAVRAAVEHEYHRQIEQWKQDGRVMGAGEKTTRGWDDQREVTVLQREKEDAHDYRYFPEPDLPPVIVDEAWRKRIADELPELPADRRDRYMNDYGLPAADAVALTGDRGLCEYFEACTGAVSGRLGEPREREAGYAAGKMLLNQLSKLAHERECDVDELGLSPEQVGGVIALRDAGEIGSSSVEDLLTRLCGTDDDAESVADAAGLRQVRDADQLEQWIEQAVSAQQQAAEDYAAGKDAAAGRLIGQVMKLSGGQADAKAVREALNQRLR